MTFNVPEKSYKLHYIIKRKNTPSRYFLERQRIKAKLRLIKEDSYELTWYKHQGESDYDNNPKK